MVGALPRIWHFQRARDAVLLGIGAAILVNSRPLEGFILGVPVMVALVFWLWGRTRLAAEKSCHGRTFCGGWSFRSAR